MGSKSTVPISVHGLEVGSRGVEGIGWEEKRPATHFRHSPQCTWWLHARGMRMDPATSDRSSQGGTTSRTITQGVAGARTRDELRCRADTRPSSDLPEWCARDGIRGWPSLTSPHSLASPSLSARSTAVIIEPIIECCAGHRLWRERRHW